MFSATMRLDNSATDKNRREQFVDSVLSVSQVVDGRTANNLITKWLVLFTMPLTAISPLGDGVVYRKDRFRRIRSTVLSP